jgi:4-carboxymuconolactone decarboxylase
MSRLRSLRYDDLGPEAKQVWDGVVGSRGAELVTADGGLIGPFNAFLHAPAVGRRLSSLGAAVRFQTSLERRLSELAILAVSARWRAEFEWYAHAPMAREHGVSEAVIEAIGQGGDPPIAAEDERVVYAAARELAETGRLGQQTYEAGLALLGEQGMVELVALCGYYTLIAYLLNAFEVPVPPGQNSRGMPSSAPRSSS